jgi:hypothetical protein
VSLPIDYQARKNLPVITGVVDYFPDALAAVAEVSKAGNDQHNPGEPLHWARSKSLDHVNPLGRHLIERGTIDIDNVRHSAKMAWRALAELQTEIEAERAGMTRAEYDKHLAAGGKPGLAAEEAAKVPRMIHVDRTHVVGAPCDICDTPQLMPDLVLKQEPTPFRGWVETTPDQGVEPAVVYPVEAQIRWDQPVEEPGDDIGNLKHPDEIARANEGRITASEIRARGALRGRGGV